MIGIGPELNRASESKAYSGDAVEVGGAVDAVHLVEKEDHLVDGELVRSNLGNEGVVGHKKNRTRLVSGKRTTRARQ